MIKKVIRKILAILSKMTGWQIILLPKNTSPRPTATKSDFGFWYAGNVFDASDIAYGIFRNGIVETEETKLVTKILTKLTSSLNSVHFYDIGANSGYYGILASYLGKGKTKAFSFEPLKEHTSLIQETVFLNKLQDSVQIFETALGATESISKIQLAGSGSSLVTGFLGNKSNNPTREISVAVLDNIIEKDNLPAPHFIKIDVEGFELEVLNGSKKTIINTLPILFIEIASSLKTTHGMFISNTATGVFDLLTSLGYNAYIVKETTEPVTSVSQTEGAYMYLFLNKQNPLHNTITQSL